MSDTITDDYDLLECGQEFSKWRINESLGMVFVATAYLRNRAGRPSRKTLESLRDSLVKYVKYKRMDFHGHSSPGGYNFDRDSLWNDYFMKFPCYREVIEHRGIKSLDELEIRALEYQEAHRPTTDISFDTLSEQGIEDFDFVRMHQGKRNRNIKYDNE